jgi:hypothetical protein
LSNLYKGWEIFSHFTFHKSQESTVPTIAVPSRIFAAISLSLSINQRILRAEKYSAIGSPHNNRKESFEPEVLTNFDTVS